MATLANCTLSCETRNTCLDCFGYIPTNPISSDLWVVWEPVPVLVPKPCAMEHVWKAAMNRAEKFRLLLEQKGASNWLHEQKAYRRPQTQIHTGIIHRKIHALYIQFFSKRSGIDKIRFVCHVSLLLLPKQCGHTEDALTSYGVQGLRAGA